ncbi:MAG: transcriptional regulator [Actinomycetota bacterium]|nr:transcriptional regulator [Actinomycetota bacterium]
MIRSAGNRKLKAARLAKGYGSQRALADALNAAARDLGLRGVSIGERQVRRWESENPPWPHSHHQQVLTHVLGFGMDDLGFRAIRESGADRARHSVAGQVKRNTHEAGMSDTSTVVRDPSAVAASCAAIAAIRRRLYWIADPRLLHRAVIEDLSLGRTFLSGMDGPARKVLARALAESALLAGRIEFFDLRQPVDAANSFVRALQLAGEAEDSLLGAAILAHAAFIPGWEGDREGASDRLAAARSHARRAETSGLMWAWLDAVDAECATLGGDTTDALNLISRAESHLRDDPSLSKPEWMDWFTPVRLGAFKGNIELKAGQTRRAEKTLSEALAGSPPDDTKQRAVIFADLAAAELAQKRVVRCCERLGEALDELAQQWYATAMERIRDVRRALRPWQDEQCVRELDERLYDWKTALNVLRS